MLSFWLFWPDKTASNLSYHGPIGSWNLGFYSLSLWWYFWFDSWFERSYNWHSTSSRFTICGSGLWAIHQRGFRCLNFCPFRGLYVCRLRKSCLGSSIAKDFHFGPWLCLFDKTQSHFWQLLEIPSSLFDRTKIDCFHFWSSFNLDIQRFREVALQQIRYRKDLYTQARRYAFSALVRHSHVFLLPLNLTQITFRLYFAPWALGRIHVSSLRLFRPRIRVIRAARGGRK